MNLAYIAGFVDGEGCIGFSKCRTTIFPRVLVVNTNRGILEDLQVKFGGDIKPLSLRKSNWKQGWQWRISWTRAVNFLDKINPWLRLKSQQACAVFAWDTVRPGMGNDWDSETRDYLVSYMKSLNMKGAIALDEARRSGARIPKKTKSHKGK